MKPDRPVEDDFINNPALARGARSGELVANKVQVHNSRPVVAGICVDPCSGAKTHKRTIGRAFGLQFDRLTDVNVNESIGIDFRCGTAPGSHRTSPIKMPRYDGGVPMAWR